MALWQYDLHVIPRSGLSLWLSLPDAPMPSVVDEESWEHVEWWEGTQPETLKQLFSSLLPSLESWDPESPSWGLEDGHRIDLVLEGSHSMMCSFAWTFATCPMVSFRGCWLS